VSKFYDKQAFAKARNPLKSYEIDALKDVKGRKQNSRDKKQDLKKRISIMDALIAEKRQEESLSLREIS